MPFALKAESHLTDALSLALELVVLVLAYRGVGGPQRRPSGTRRMVSEVAALVDLRQICHAHLDGHRPFAVSEEHDLAAFVRLGVER